MAFNEFYLKKKYVLLSGYLDFCVFVKSTNLKICVAIIDLAAWRKLHFCLFLLYPKYYQNEILSNTVSHNKHFQHVFGSILTKL